jgi:phosphotransferase system  glucose/maltose/N-acetylglucosamine-specific IIC component
MNKVQRQLLQTRFLLVVAALVLAGLAMGVHQLIR